MMAYGTWLTPAATQTAAMTILHFLWQGAALAAMASASMALSRRATTRYAIAVVMLALMVVAPALTFMVLQQRSFAADFGGGAAVVSQRATDSAAVEFSRTASFPIPSNAAQSPNYLSWL